MSLEVSIVPDYVRAARFAAVKARLNTLGIKDFIFVIPSLKEFPVPITQDASVLDTLPVETMKVAGMPVKVLEGSPFPFGVVISENAVRRVEGK